MSQVSFNKDESYIFKIASSELQTNSKNSKKKSSRVVKLTDDVSHHILLKEPTNNVFKRIKNKLTHVSVKVKNIEGEKTEKISLNIRQLSKKMNMSVSKILYKRITGRLDLHTLRSRALEQKTINTAQVSYATSKNYSFALKICNDYIRRDQEFLKIKAENKVQKEDIKILSQKNLIKIKQTNGLDEKLECLISWKNEVVKLFEEKSGHLPEGEDLFPAIMLSLLETNEPDLIRTVYELYDYVQQNDQILDFNEAVHAAVSNFYLAAESILNKANEIQNSTTNK